MQGTGTRSWLATCIHYWQEPTWIGCLVPSVLPRHLKANCTPCPCLSIFTTLTPLQVWLLQGAETSLDQMSFDQQSRSRVINDLFRTFYWSFNALSKIFFSLLVCLMFSLTAMNKYWLKVIIFLGVWSQMVLLQRLMTPSCLWNPMNPFFYFYIFVSAGFSKKPSSWIISFLSQFYWQLKHVMN